MAGGQRDISAAGALAAGALECSAAPASMNVPKPSENPRKANPSGARRPCSASPQSAAITPITIAAEQNAVPRTPKIGIQNRGAPTAPMIKDAMPRPLAGGRGAGGGGGMKIGWPHDGQSGANREI